MTKSEAAKNEVIGGQGQKKIVFPSDKQNVVYSGKNEIFGESSSPETLASVCICTDLCGVSAKQNCQL